MSIEITHLSAFSIGYVPPEDTDDPVDDDTDTDPDEENGAIPGYPSYILFLASIGTLIHLTKRRK